VLPRNVSQVYVVLLYTTHLNVLTGSPILQSRSNKSAGRSNETQEALDAGGDTDPATDVEETQTLVVGTKRKATGSARLVSTYVLGLFVLCLCFNGVY